MPKNKNGGRPGGRPTKLTLALQKRFLAIIRDGSYLTPACEAVGISYQTFQNWRERGELEKTGRYVEFLVAYKKASAQSEVSALGAIRKAMKKPHHWTAAMTFLERRFPERWGKTEHQSIDLSTSVTDEQAEEQFDAVLRDVISKRNLEESGEG